MKIVVDMNLSPIWVQVLRDAGFDATHWRDIGQHDAEDATVLEWAKQHGHAVFTHDLDFGAILAAGGANAPSVIQFRVGDPLPSIHAEMVVRAIKHFEAELRDGALISIEPGRSRARFLPLQG
jgi:predicted nuclease of predicted toxin-antitoxin system